MSDICFAPTLTSRLPCMDITLGHDENLLGFGDFGLKFKVTAEQYRSNLSVCGVYGGGDTSVFSVINTVKQWCEL